MAVLAEAVVRIFLFDLKVEVGAVIVNDPGPAL